MDSDSACSAAEDPAVNEDADPIEASLRIARCQDSETLLFG